MRSLSRCVSLVVVVACGSSPPPPVQAPPPTPPPAPKPAAAPLVAAPAPTPTDPWPDVAHITIDGPPAKPIVVRVVPSGLGQQGDCGAPPPQAVLDVLAPAPKTTVYVKSGLAMLSVHPVVDGKMMEAGCSTWGPATGGDALMKPVVLALSVMSAFHEQRRPFTVLVFAGERPADPLALSTPMPAGSALADRALEVRYPVLLDDDLRKDTTLPHRLVMTAPKELFVFAARDLDDAQLITYQHRLDVDYHPRSYVRPKRGEPLLWTGNLAITVDGDVFWVAEDALSVEPPAALVMPATPCNLHKMRQVREPPADETPAQKDARARYNASATAHTSCNARIQNRHAKEYDEALHALDKSSSPEASAKLSAVEKLIADEQAKRCPATEANRDLEAFERSFQPDRRHDLDEARARLNGMFAH